MKHTIKIYKTMIQIRVIFCTIAFYPKCCNCKPEKKIREREWEVTLNQVDSPSFPVTCYVWIKLLLWIQLSLFIFYLNSDLTTFTILWRSAIVLTLYVNNPFWVGVVFSSEFETADRQFYLHSTCVLSNSENCEEIQGCLY